MSNWRGYWELVALLIFATSLILEPATAREVSREDYEPEILEIVEAINSGHLDTALELTESHVTTFPKSRVGHLLKADILQAMANQLTVIGGIDDSSEIINSDAEAAKRLVGLRHQIKNRWQHRKLDSETAHSMVPASLIDMGRHRHVLVTDMQAGRLYLYRNSHRRPELVRDYYLSVGSAGYGKELEGDNKTPVGVYSIYQHIAGAELPDLYGKGAYPVNYPNRFDRARKRTGYGIWLHGTPSNTYARSPWASEGCFVLSNDDLLDIERYIDVDAHTPVILAEKIEWISATELQQRRQNLVKTLAAWQRDWESLDIDAYLSHYSEQNFNFGTEDFASWAKRKQQVNQGKTFVQVDVEIDSLFLYPGEDEMFVVQYTQRYLSNNYAGEAQKEQYWQRDESGRWRIIYES